MQDALIEIAKTLSPTEWDFVNAYHNDLHHNATAVYHRLHPEITYASATSQACVVLARPHVRNALLQLQALTATKTLSKDKHVDNALTVMDEARAEKQYGAYFRGHELVAKYKGWLDAHEDAANMYVTFLQNHVNNTQVVVMQGQGNAAPGVVHNATDQPSPVAIEGEYAPIQAADVASTP